MACVCIYIEIDVALNAAGFVESTITTTGTCILLTVYLLHIFGSLILAFIFLEFL